VLATPHGEGAELFYGFDFDQLRVEQMVGEAPWQ
jgi:hypothetical protein